MRRGGKSRRREKGRSTPSPHREKTGKRRALNTYTSLFLGSSALHLLLPGLFLCLSLLFGSPSWPRSPSHALSYPRQPLSVPAGLEPQPAALPPAGRDQGSGMGWPRRSAPLEIGLFPPRPLSPSTLPAVHLEYLGFLNGVSRIRSPRRSLAVG